MANVKFNIPDINWPGINQEMLDNINEAQSYLAESVKIKEEMKERRYQNSVDREQRMIELLESIDNNTSVLNDILVLIKNNNENQREIIEVITEFINLAVIKDKKELDSKYRFIMDKIKTTISDIETMNKLSLYGITIYNILKSIN